MSLINKLSTITPSQLKELEQTIIDAGISQQLNGNWREVFRKMANKYSIGNIHKIYAVLSKANQQDVLLMIDAIIKQ